MSRVPDPAHLSLAADVLACGGAISEIAHELERTFGASKVDAGERAVDLLRELARDGNVNAHTEMLAVAQDERTKRPWGCSAWGKADGWYAVGRSGTQGPYESLRAAMIRNTSAW